MDEMKSLAGMFSSIAEILQQRDAVLMDKIGRLEARVVELEEKLRGFGPAVEEIVSAVPAVEEVASSAPAVEEVAEIGYPAVEGENVEIAEDDGEPAEDVGEELSEDADEVMIVEKMEEQPEIEIEFEFEEESGIQEPEDIDMVDIEENDAAGMELEEAERISGEGIGNRQELVVDKARPDWYDWEVDIPGPYIEDIRDGIGLNDRILFLNELFYGDEEAFASVISALNGMGRLVDAVEYIRERYPQWDEESDEVYRFYMTVRRRFNKQIRES